MTIGLENKSYRVLDRFREEWGNTLNWIVLLTGVNLFILFINRNFLMGYEFEALLQFYPTSQFLLPLLFVAGGYLVKDLLFPLVKKNKLSSLMFTHVATGVMATVTIFAIFQLVLVGVLCVVYIPVLFTMFKELLKHWQGVLALLALIFNLVIAFVTVKKMKSLTEDIFSFARLDDDNPLDAYQGRWFAVTKNFIYIPYSLMIISLIQQIVMTMNSEYGYGRSSGLDLFGSLDLFRIRESVVGINKYALFFTFLGFVLASVLVPLMNRKKRWAFTLSNLISGVVAFVTAIAFISISKDFFLPLLKNLQVLKAPLEMEGAPGSAIWIVWMLYFAIVVLTIFLIRAFFIVAIACTKSIKVYIQTAGFTDVDKYEGALNNHFLYGVEHDEEGTGSDESEKSMVSPTLSVKERIVELKDLLDDKLITQSDFDAKKALLLEEL